MVETNSLWIASYLHEMLGSYVRELSGGRTESQLYAETLLAAHIVEFGIQSFDDGFVEFTKAYPDTKASSLYQVVRRFPDEAVRSGATLMIERLTTAAPGNGLLPLKTGVSMETEGYGSLACRPEIRPEIRQCSCREVRPGAWTVEPK